MTSTVAHGRRLARVYFNQGALARSLSDISGIWRGSVSLKNWVCADGLGSDAAYPKLAFMVRMRFRSRDLGLTRAIGGPSHFLGPANQRMCGCKVVMPWLSPRIWNEAIPEQSEGSVGVACAQSKSPEVRQCLVYTGRTWCHATAARAGVCGARPVSSVCLASASALC